MDLDRKDFALTFACYNAVGYTRQCLDSLVRAGIPLERVVAVDNASHDETAQVLGQYSLGAVISNRSNLGCGVAWNQGILAFQAEWTIVMNNDVLVTPGFVEQLLGAADSHQLSIVSPGLIEGPLDYDLEQFATDAATRMRGVARNGAPHAVCMAVHSAVWQKLGYFAPNPSLWGYEDTLFFHQASKLSIPMATVGDAWLHHYGSITQNEIRQERGLKAEQGLGARHNYRLLQQSWWQRKWNKLKRQHQRAEWRRQELVTHDMTLHGLRQQGSFVWL